MISAESGSGAGPSPSPSRPRKVTCADMAIPLFPSPLAMKSNPARDVGAAPRDPGDGEPGGQLLTVRLLHRLSDELIRDPPGDADGVGLCRQAEGDVPEAGVERFADQIGRAHV